MVLGSMLDSKDPKLDPRRSREQLEVLILGLHLLNKATVWLWL